MKAALYATALSVIWMCQLSASAYEIEMKKNDFEDPVVVIHNPDTPTAQALEIIAKNIQPEKPIFVRIPKGDLERKLNESGFEDQDDNKCTRLLVKRYKGTPPPRYTDITGAKVLITKTEGNALKALFTLERNKTASWAGGVSERGEFALDTAVRESREELDLDINPDKLRLLTVVQVPYGEKNIMNNQFIYHWPYDGQEITKDPREILDVIWGAIKNVLEDHTVNGYPVRSHKLTALEGLLRQEVQGTPCLRKLSFRQESKSEKDQDPDDVMHIYSVGQTTKE